MVCAEIASLYKLTLDAPVNCYLEVEIPLTLYIPIMQIVQKNMWFSVQGQGL